MLVLFVLFSKDEDILLVWATRPPPPPPRRQSSSRERNLLLLLRVSFSSAYLSLRILKIFSLLASHFAPPFLLRVVHPKFCGKNRLSYKKRFTTFPDRMSLLCSSFVGGAGLTAPSSVSTRARRRRRRRRRRRLDLPLLFDFSRSSSRSESIII